MTPPQQIERNTRRSFQLVKDDVLMLEREHRYLLQRVTQLEEAQKKLLFLLAERNNHGFVGNKHTKDLHAPDCILAQSTQAEDTLLFASRKEGKNKGYDECICLA